MVALVVVAGAEGVVVVVGRQTVHLFAHLCMISCRHQRLHRGFHPAKSSQTCATTDPSPTLFRFSSASTNGQCP